MAFLNRLSSDQVGDLDKDISIDEIRKAAWDCGESKSPGPDGFTFEFFRRYWHFIGPDFYAAVNCFFVKGRFPRGSNSYFIALIPKVMDAKFVTDFRPISLIGSVYKVVTKILANRLTTVISGLISNTQSTFVANRHILDGPFILNKVLARCKRRRKQALVFKVDFAKAYDSVRWDFLLDVLLAFGFGPKWCQWIRGIFSSNMASILINGSPSSEFPIFSGLKQGDPLAPFLFILVMQSLHLSVTRAINDGIFKGLRITSSSSLSHLFYADDAIFIGEWSIKNLDNLLKILNCFHLALGLCINVNKSHILAVGVPLDIVCQGALRIGCEVMQTPFKYLGVMVGDHMSRYSAWSNTIQKVYGPLTRWKVKTLSIGGRLTLFKSVLGGDSRDSKITWVAWVKVLSSKKNGGLGVSSFSPSTGLFFSNGYGDTSFKMVLYGITSSVLFTKAGMRWCRKESVVCSSSYARRSKTHTVGEVWPGEYMDHGFTKSMSELDRCYTMLQELHYVIIEEGSRIAMVPPKVTSQLPKLEVKIEENILKAKVVDEHIE
nr:RNA-directed DNA polymerase, eukaryota [Tanacetum cinerariifolium]